MVIENVHGRRRVANQTTEGEMNNWIGCKNRSIHVMMFYCSGVVNVLERMKKI